MANLSQQKRQRMLEFLQTIREEHKDDDNVLIAIGETLYLKSINNEYKLDTKQYENTHTGAFLLLRGCSSCRTL